MKPSLASTITSIGERSSTRASPREKITARLLALLALEKRLDVQIALLRERKTQTKARIDSVRVELAGKQLELGFVAKRRGTA